MIKEKREERKLVKLVETFLNEIGLSVDNQNKCMADGIEKAIKNFKPKKRFNLYKLA